MRRVLTQFTAFARELLPNNIKTEKKIENKKRYRMMPIMSLIVKDTGKKHFFFYSIFRLE